jgi:pyruvate ferredoxin oxidoreductase beta subunit/2-oxoisovalerate ferredoxin oxidoreductase beta subunit
MRYCLKALGEKTIIVVPAGCWTILSGAFPTTAYKIPMFHTAFETAASCACGVKAALRMQGKDDINVLAWAGDGGTLDIGIQALSGAAERNDDFIYVCYDNEAYMNTGIQRSSSTPYGAATTTTPANMFKDTPKKDIIEIMIAHNIPYAATAAIAYPEDLIKKVQTAKSIKGTKFIHILVPCPPGWKYSSEKTIQLSRLAVATGAFVLYEFKGGKYIVKKIDNKKSIEEYLALQGRFKHLSKQEIQEIQTQVDRRLEILLKKEQL